MSWQVSEHLPGKIRGPGPQKNRLESGIEE